MCVCMCVCVIYTCVYNIYIYNIYNFCSRFLYIVKILSVHHVHYVPKCMSCHCFHDYVCVTLPPASLRFEHFVCDGSSMTTYMTNMVFTRFLIA